MQILQAWGESLTIFKPSNFKLFILVTLRSLGQTYVTLATRFWIVLLIALLTEGVPYWLLTCMASYEHEPLVWGMTLLWVAIFLGTVLISIGLCFTIFLSARPSVLLKDWSYLLSYRRHFLYFVPIFFCAMLIRHLVLLPFVYSIFVIAFLLDSDARLVSAARSLWRAGVMVLYNAPFVCITSILFVGLFYPINLFLSADVAWSSFLFFIARFVLVHFVQLPIMICFYMNFYSKKIHEQFTLYYHIKGQ